MKLILLSHSSCQTRSTTKNTKELESSMIPFFEAAVANYCKLLRLVGNTRTGGSAGNDGCKRAQVLPEFIVPTCSIDLMWHTEYL